MLNEGVKDSSLSKTSLIPPNPNAHKRANQEIYVRNNQVTTVMLHGVSIVCLTIEGKERLCLAQISNTLLKSYSYNEIHNRRVALGITCVQCTPVQLEILRRAGAMPISSRRCGMITKREAERLVKSFLEDNSPPKLPENFCFDVYHECGWGGRGKFEPSRYNSSRAKCIKCIYCNMYFSPNKFIFHFHKAPDAKYNHPDAANFNSWRRHLKLVAFDSEDVVHAWEDVKAMFNGGSRKRLLSSAVRDQSSSHRSHSPNVVKKSRINVSTSENSDPYQNAYPPFPFISVPGKTYPMSPFTHSPPFGIGMHFNKDTFETKANSAYQSNWSLPNLVPSYGMVWNPGLINPNRLQLSNNSCYPLKLTNGNESRQKEEHEANSSPECSPTFCDKSERFSAFRPVGRNLTSRNTPDSTNTDDKLSEYSDEINITDDLNNKEEKSHNQGHLEDVASRKSPMSSGPVETSYQADDDITKVCEANDNEKNVKEENQDGTKTCSLSEREQPTNEIEEALDLCCKSTTVATEPEVRLSKEELQDQLKKEIDLRKQIEKEITDIKDALSHELLQERHVRLTLHQKLKEAQEALTKFSSSMSKI